MPATFQILPQRQLALFTYSGFVTLAEALAVVTAYAQHPDHQPWMRQFCDLAAVTGVERNFPELLKMQAKFVETLLPAGRDLLVAFYAPNRAGQELAQMARKSWEGLNAVVVLVHDTEAEALALLGLRERSLTELQDGVALNK
jgi:hypothetical protein